jgi:hypothetical protein
VSRLFLGLAEKTGPMPRVLFRLLNGWPAMAVELEEGDRRPGIASRFTIHFELDSAGLIRQLDIVAAPGKLSGSERGYFPLTSRTKIASAVSAITLSAVS